MIMIFCGTRIKTQTPEKKAEKKLELLEVQKDMWDCEKKAIKNHNAQVRLQNKGASLSTLKTIDMSFLGKLGEDKKPIFGVFPTTTFDCTLEIRLNRDGAFDRIASGLPKAIGDGYKLGLKGKKLHNGYKHYSLNAEFSGLLPKIVKEKIVALRKAGISTFLVAETGWVAKEIPKNPDPLVIAHYKGKVYLVDVFDASIEENYVAHEFTEDPENG
jgi:hypothetical protein